MSKNGMYIYNVRDGGAEGFRTAPDWWSLLDANTLLQVFIVSKSHKIRGLGMQVQKNREKLENGLAAPAGYP